MTPIFSVVMAYYNRKPILLQTLRSIAASTQAKYTEVIIVDDGSSEEHRLEDIVDDYPFTVKLLRQEPEDKWYTNPCIPFNLGIKEATGDIIVLQNPECFHLGDILEFSTSIQQDKYYTFHAYSLSKDSTAIVPEIDPVKINALGSNINQDQIPITLHNWGMNLEGGDGYYNHSQFRPTAYHFCAATSRSNMEDLGGFDERYASGCGFDDNELVERIKRKGLQICFVSYPLVLHQNHYKVSGNEMALNRNMDLVYKNMRLFNEVTMHEKTWRVNQNV